MSKYDFGQLVDNLTWSYSWPLIFSWWASPLVYYYAVHKKHHFNGDQLILETGVGRLPWHMIYKKGMLVGTDYLKGVVKTNRFLTKLVRTIKKPSKEEFVVCNNRYLPFRDGVFDAAVSVAGYHYREEITRVLKDEGTKVLIGAEMGNWI